MQFTITISGEGPELAKALTNLKTVMDGHKITDGSVSASVEPAKEKPVKKTAEPVQQKKDDEQPAETVEESTSGDAEAVPTDVELRAAAAAKGKAPGGKEKVKGLLAKYDVPNVTGVPAEDRSAFLRDLEAL